MKVVSAALTEALAAEGFSAAEPLDYMEASEPGTRNPSWIRMWWTAAGNGIPQAPPVVTAHLAQTSRGGVSISGEAWIYSETVEEVLETLADSVDNFRGSLVESVTFGYFDDPQDPMRAIEVSRADGIDYGISQFMRSVRGPVAQWLSQRGTLSKLFELARTPNLMGIDRANPDPTRLRGTAVLGVVNGRAEDAAALVGWYLSRGRLHKWDSFEKASAFDAAMAQRYGDYARARNRHEGLPI